MVAEGRRREDTGVAWGKPSVGSMGPHILGMCLERPGSVLRGDGTEDRGGRDLPVAMAERTHQTIGRDCCMIVTVYDN